MNAITAPTAPSVAAPMRANAALSLAMGSLLALTGPPVSGWLGVDVGGWLRLLGVALVGHGVALLLVSNRPDAPTWAKVNLAVIAPYPAGLLVVLAVGWVDTTLGRVLLVADAAAVGAIAVWHIIQLRPGAEEVRG